MRFDPWFTWRLELSIVFRRPRLSVGGEADVGVVFARKLGPSTFPRHAQAQERYKPRYGAIELTSQIRLLLC